MKKLLIIQPTNDKVHQELNSGYEKLPPSLALATLESAVKKYSPDTKIKIVDGVLGGYRDILNSINEDSWDYIGISNLFYNTSETVRIAKYIRENSPESQIILGNINAGAQSQKFLERNLANKVVIGHGEGGLIKILRGEPTPIEVVEPWNINYLSEINLESFRDFLHPYNSREPNYDIEKITPFPISATRGCIKAIKRKRCSFCSTPYKKVEILTPENFWNMVGNFYYKYGINYFFEAGDDFLIGNYPEKILEARPLDLDGIQFRFYGDLDNINKTTIKILKRLGLRDFFIGLENVDEKILERANKRYNISYKNFDDIFRIYDQLEAVGINFYLPILFGIPGESEESLERNQSFVEQMFARYSHLTKFYHGIVVPTAGTELFEDLTGDKDLNREYLKYHKEIYGQNTENDLKSALEIDYTLLMKLMIKHRCDVTSEEIFSVMRYLTELAEKRLGKKNVADNFGVFPFEKYDIIR